MSRTEKAKKSIFLRLFAAVGWLAIKITKVLLKVLSVVGVRVAKRKLDDLESRRGSRHGGAGTDVSRREAA